MPFQTKLRRGQRLILRSPGPIEIELVPDWGVKIHTPDVDIERTADEHGKGAKVWTADDGA